MPCTWKRNQALPHKFSFSVTFYQETYVSGDVHCFLAECLFLFYSTVFIYMFDTISVVPNSISGVEGVA